jgi:zinc protease
MGHSANLQKWSSAATNRAILCGMACELHDSLIRGRTPGCHARATQRKTIANKLLKSFYRHFTFLASGGVFLVTAAATSARGTPPPPPRVKVPEIIFKHSTLDNKLEVYSVEDHASPTVAVQVWYHVGSKDDPARRSGFAHLFEHMMFKGNEHLKPDTFQQLTEGAGGEMNAFTANDVTVYHEVIPSNYLEPVLWAEAERMSSLALNEANFGSERNVVKEEYRQRYAANPYGELMLAIPQNSYAIHPYKRPGIGNIVELDASTLPEVQAFHAAFYRPDNATLVVVGDFKPEQLADWIGKYFGAIPKPTGDIPRVKVNEPERGEDHREVIYSAKAPLPAFAITYLAPSVRSDDAIALGVASDILSGGTSSRLYQSLIYEQQLAQSVSFATDLNQDLGLLNFQVTLASGKTVADTERALDVQIEKVLNHGVDEAELAKAKNQYLTGKLFGLETAHGKAFALGSAAVMLGDASRVNSDLAKIQAITAEEVIAALRKYMVDKKKVVIEYLPEAMRKMSSPPATPR